MPTSFLEGLNLVCPSCSDDFRPGPRLEYTNQGQEPHSSTICAFLERPARYVYCSGCKLWHPKLAFSPAQQREGPNERICIGREGVLRVCEHLSIPWTDIEARIAQARVAFPQDWRLFMAALEQIEFVCKDESHVLPCRFDRSSEPRRGSWLEPSFPRATVVARQGICESQGLCLCLTLELSWQPHSGQLQWPLKKKVEQLETSASGMRDLVSFYRQSVARFIVPDRSPRYMPEMLCFDPDQCSCLHYESGLSEEESTPSLYEKQECTQMPIKSERVFTEPQLETRHHYTFGQNTRDTSSVQIFRCRDLTAAPEGDTDGTLGSCIVTRYNRRIFLGILFWRDVTRAGATTGLQSPSHEWSHAMDPDSYQWSSSIPRDDQEMFVQRRCLHVWHSRYFRQPNLCSQVRAARGFLSVDSLNLPDSRVVAPRWMPLREDLSLRNLPCLVVEWICGAYQGYDVYRALPSCEINFRHLRRSIALVVSDPCMLALRETSVEDHQLTATCAVGVGRSVHLCVPNGAYRGRGEQNRRPHLGLVAIYSEW